MTPRRLDPPVILKRLREIQLLLAGLVEIGEVDAERLRRERSTRHVVERVLSQIVELAGSINTHIVAALLGRSPESYADSFDEVARAGVLEWDLAAALRPSAG
ncbi:MAG TPA: HepT-like ribonuclease domain-containing protein, partial [Pseudonocardiaceae bacterium]|nr:HepT-like ribonuclease domain-containing protein [Pseudonocardiaceae bacterium]